MTRKILFATIVVAFTFSGCSQLLDSKPAKEEAVKSTSKAVKVTKKVTESAESALPQSSMKDKVVEVADEKTDGATTKVIESVK